MHTRYPAKARAPALDLIQTSRTIVLMDTHYHIWYYRRDRDGTIRSMERDDRIYPKRRQANYVLSDGRKYWKAGQVLQCVNGAFCQPLPKERVDWGISSPPKYVPIGQLEDEAQSIRPALKHSKAMKLRDELDAQGRVNSPEAELAEIAYRQATVNAELAMLRKKSPWLRVPPLRQG